MLSGVADGGRVHEVSLGPIDSDQFYLLQGHELIAYDLLTAEPRWRTTDTPSSGVILMRGNQLAVVSPHHHEIALFDKRDGRRLATQPFGDFQLWAATDESLLVYQDDAAGRRTLTLWDPFTGQSLLTHTFTDLSPTNGVFGRIVLSRYAVTLSTRGNLLIWDLQQAKQIALAELGEIPNLHGLNVLLRPESLVVLPTAGTPAERGGAAVQNTSGQDHVQVDHLIANVSLSDGQLLWNHSLENESWGCTLSQATASPLLVLSRGNNYYQTTNSRTRTVDIKAIDLRDGQAQQSLGLPVESIGNEIETTLMVQAHEQLVAVAVGNSLRLEYRFSDTPAETPAVPLPAADAIDVGPAAAAGRDLMDDLFVPLDSGDLFGPPEPLSDPPPTER